MLRISIATLVALIALTGVSLACLVYATSSWAGFPNLAYAIALIIAPIGVLHREGNRRAFSIGFALAAWGYLALPLIPTTQFGPMMQVLLDLAYPRFIAEHRQPFYQDRLCGIPLTSLAKDQKLDNLGKTIDVKSGDATIARGVRVTAKEDRPDTTGPAEFLVDVHFDQSEKLLAAISANKTLTLVGSSASFTPVFPVDRNSFGSVAKAVIGLYAGLFGGFLGVRFYRTQEE